MQRVFDVSAHITGYTFDTKFGTRPSRIDINGQSYYLNSRGITISIGKGKNTRRVISVEAGKHTINLRQEDHSWSVANIH